MLLKASTPRFSAAFATVSCFFAVVFFAASASLKSRFRLIISSFNLSSSFSRHFRCVVLHGREFVCITVHSFTAQWPGSRY